MKIYGRVGHWALSDQGQVHILTSKVFTTIQNIKSYISALAHDKKL